MNSFAKTLLLFIAQFVVLGALACAAGLLVALAGQQLLVVLLSAAFGGGLPPPTWSPAIAAFITGMLLLFGFALPPLIALAKVPPLRVLRRDLPRPRAGGAGRNQRYGVFLVSGPRRDVWTDGCPVEVTRGVWR